MHFKKATSGWGIRKIATVNSNHSVHYLDERIKFSNGRDIIRNEAPQWRLELHFVGLVALNVLKQIAHLAGHVQALVISGIVRAFEVIQAVLSVAVVVILPVRIFIFVLAVRLCVMRMKNAGVSIWQRE